MTRASKLLAAQHSVEALALLNAARAMRQAALDLRVAGRPGLAAQALRLARGADSARRSVLKTPSSAE